MWRAEDNLWELLLLFQHVGSGDQTQVVRVGIMSLYLLSLYLAAPI